MESNDIDQLVAQLVSEILAAVDGSGALESWIDKRLIGSIDAAALDAACTQVADRFLSSDPPRTGPWEQLLVTLAFHSSRTQQAHSLGACKSILRHLGASLSDERSQQFKPKLMILASVMTVVLAIQYKLTQDIEAAMGQLCARFPDELPGIAEECQDVWKRRGQMSGRPGLFLWDTREQEWRLAKDFTPYRPDA